AFVLVRCFHLAACWPSKIFTLLLLLRILQEFKNMEFSAKKSDILRELNLTQGVVEKKTTIPILSNLLLEATGETLRISATDLELGVRCGCLAKIKKEGSSTIPANRV